MKTLHTLCVGKLSTATSRPLHFTKSRWKNILTLRWSDHIYIKISSGSGFVVMSVTDEGNIFLHSRHFSGNMTLFFYFKSHMNVHSHQYTFEQIVEGLINMSFPTFQNGECIYSFTRHNDSFCFCWRELIS